MANRTQDLFNVITRQQVYVEGLKEGQQRLALLAFADMEKELRTAILGLDVEDVSELTQAQIRALLRTLKAILTKFYSATLSRYIQFLSDWLVYEAKETPALLSDDDNAIVPLPGASDLWKQISKEPMGATGDTIASLLGALSAVAYADISRRVKGGIADNLSLRDFLAYIVGTKALNGRNGVLNKQRNALGSAIATTMQQVVTQVRDKAYGLLTDYYMWNSVIDGATTDICRGRNGRTYRRGSGPLPPAHYGCRSSTIPVFVGERLVLPPSYFAWVSAQPVPFARDILPRRLHGALAKGELRAADLPRFSEPAPLTLEQYKSKTKQIKTGTDN